MKRQAAGCIIALLTLVIPADTFAQTSPQPRSAYESIPGFSLAETPDELDRVAFVRHWFGPPKPASSPRAVLILVPGFFGGAEDFRYAGERLVRRLPWLQVWAVDRRNNLLENRCGMETAQILRNPLAALAYYFGLQELPGCPLHGDPDESTWNGLSEFGLSQAEAQAVGMAEWGIATQLQDLRLLVEFAHRQHRQARVFLGGHSLGGMTAQIFAAWRFGSTSATSGWHLIDGIVLIDGGVNGQAWGALVAQYFAERALVESGVVYWDRLDLGRSPILTQFAEIGGMAASLMPAQESVLWQLLPGPLAWPDASTCPTNKALLAAFTDDTSGNNPDFLLHQGTLSPPVGMCAAPNQTRPLIHWVDFDRAIPPELSSTDVFAGALYKSTATNAQEWYFSIMLNAGIDLASNLDSTVPSSPAGSTAVELEGHRVFDAASVAVPVYAFAAEECRERFLWYESVSVSVPDFTLVDHSNIRCTSRASVPYTHLDPLFAFDTGGFTNAFISSLAGWLRSHTRGP